VGKETDKRTVLRYPPPEWVEALLVEGEEVGLVFLDEINTAPPALQPALLGAIQERRIGGHAFGPRVRVLAAANPTGQAAGGWDLAAPVANRLGHLDWAPPTAEEWGAWLLSGANGDGQTIDAQAEEARVMAAWPDAFARASGKVAAFLRRRPELLHKMPNDGDPQMSRAWPSPRTWEYATRALASAAIQGLSEEATSELCAAFVGNAAEAELATWLATLDLPDPAEVLAGKVNWEPDFTRLDRTEAVLSGCAAIVAAHNKTNKALAAKDAEALWALLLKCDRAKDLTVTAAKLLVDLGYVAGRGALAALAGLNAVMQAAGGRS
jgi:MoxR-like ATPase